MSTQSRLYNTKIIKKCKKGEKTDCNTNLSFIVFVDYNTKIRQTKFVNSLIRRKQFNTVATQTHYLTIVAFNPSDLYPLLGQVIAVRFYLIVYTGNLSSVFSR